MSDYFTKFEGELRRAARRLAPPAGAAPRRRRPIGWRPRGFLLVGIVLIAAAVPAVAAVTGVFDTTRAPEHLSPGNGTSLAPPCKGPSPKPSRPATGPVPAALARLVGSLRRPQHPSDRLGPDELPHGGSVISDGIRLAYRAGDARYYVVPTGNVNYSPPVPNTPECAAIRRATRHRVQPGVCVWRVGGAIRGGGCSTLSQLRRLGAGGPDQGFGLGMARGTMYVSGVAADGVEAIVLRYPKGAPLRTVRIPVRQNVYAAIIRGRPELAPYVYAQTRDGIKLVQKGQRPTSRRQRELNRRSKRRDLTATGRPTVVPPIGYPHTTFTFRVRVRPLDGYVYVVRVTGPPGLCHETVKPFAINPARSGPLRGLIRLGIGYGPLGLHKMCLGSYRGVVTRVRSGAPIASGTVVKQFSFAVRRRPASR
ncbi:MAG TPA: hypothetical protein VE570_04835 [Thermoleophilaceae bacterium]|nr:hypothetical protein [Thermoleophilaceae bacterium]